MHGDLDEEQVEIVAAYFANLESLKAFEIPLISSEAYAQLQPGQRVVIMEGTGVSFRGIIR
jgi:hypothetical protein